MSLRRRPTPVPQFLHLLGIAAVVDSNEMQPLREFRTDLVLRFRVGATSSPSRQFTEERITSRLRRLRTESQVGCAPC